jgi:membrane-associated protease RseP (regulator of RpoE activity)
MAVRQRPLLHVLLFAATFFTAAMQSALELGVDVFSDPFGIRAGLPFAIAVMSILLCHELGHYALALVHRVDASLPYFIPAPPLLFPFGTLGAFIRMRSVPPNRRALFDIGAAGPWAGLLVTIPVLIIGLMVSEVRPGGLSEGGYLLGDDILFSWLTRLVLQVNPDEVTIILHPIALAGWFGLFVTSLNLIPIGQLDGGHVLYAVFGRHHRWIARGVVTFLVVLGLGGWFGWIVWAGLLAILGFDHPPPQDSSATLDRRRLIAAALTGVVFVLTFIPEPITFAEPTPPPVFEGERIPVSVPAAPKGFVIRL